MNLNWQCYSSKQQTADGSQHNPAQSQAKMFRQKYGQRDIRQHGHNSCVKLQSDSTYTVYQHDEDGVPGGD